MIGWIAPTDYDWLSFLAARPGIEEVNFWTPSTHFAFRGEPGAPFFFKLKSPHNAIAPHDVSNGILLRSDIHRLFDAGYVSVTPDYRIQISEGLKEHYQNGKTYYPYNNMPLAGLPARPQDRPDPDLLRWHNDVIFRR